MAWTSGFFNSVNGDRLYNADQMSAIFEGLITNGVYESVGNKLAVQPNSGMTIQVATGRGWFGQRWVNNDSEYLVTLEDSDVLLNRYCAVCVRVNTAEDSRSADIYLKYSDFATEPEKPEMERSETVQEYCLAYVYIAGGAAEINAANIEDTRSDTNLCGWVTGLIKQLDSATMWTQWEALFDEWFYNLQEKISENSEAQLIVDVDQLKADVFELQGRVIKSTGTFDGLGWNSTDDLYTQDVTVPGITATNDVFVTPTEEFKDAYVRMGCRVVSQSDNTLSFVCRHPEDLAMEIEVIIFNFVQ